MRWLKTVRFRGIQPQLVLAALRVEEICKTYGVACWITSGSDGRHKAASLHPKGLALDFRTRDLMEDDKNGFFHDVKDALGIEFDVVLELDHLHVEYDPKVG